MVPQLRVPIPGAGPGEYLVEIERGSLDLLPDRCLHRAPAHRYAVIADSRVAELLGKRVLAAFREAGCPADLFAFPAGEWNKTREEWARLSDELLAAGLGRDGAIIALGGGVTGDLAGFVAATYMRGVPVVQVPTTLLAMLDSSVGGKTGVDTLSAKNAIGAFWQPAHVLIDPELLATLPPHHRAAGLAEAAKAGAVRDAGFFEWMELRAGELAAGDVGALAELIERAVAIKAGVVAADPLERGERAILNFGHTIGHALEALSGYALLHGEAVGAGMRVEARLGEGLGLTRPGTADRLEALLEACGLLERPEEERRPEELLEAARRDKKGREGRLRWVLLGGIGEVLRDPEGAYTHALAEEECLVPLAAALRRDTEAADSR
ncbi:MAG: 3-dehydroquinate synthase [Gemmatimonadota bacterium]